MKKNQTIILAVCVLALCVLAWYFTAGRTAQTAPEPETAAAEPVPEKTAPVPEPEPETEAEPETVPEPDTAPDYSLPENWAYFGSEEDRDADVFLICPTVDMADEYQMSLDNEKLKRHFIGALNMERGIYEDAGRMFAPYYRQAAMKVYSIDPAERETYLSAAFADVSAAFAWYLENQNQDRPIILAGFSQGADMCYRLIETYFDDPDLYDRLVAVYAIGWPCTEDMVSAYPQIVPAQSSEDTGVVVSFECEAPELAESFILPAGIHALSINPLNWRTDTTPADKSENSGACFPGYDGAITREEAGLCGAYLDGARGALKVTDVSPADYPPAVPGLPEGSYHVYDYQFFYRNLQENVNLRLAKFLEARLENAA